MKYVYKFNAMSTPCELIIYEAQKSRADTLAESVVLEVKRLEKKYNYYNKNSYLSLINTRQEYRLDQESKMLLQRAKQYYSLTNGIFDITMATLKPLFSSERSLSELAEKKLDCSLLSAVNILKSKKIKLFLIMNIHKLTWVVLLRNTQWIVPHLSLKRKR